MALDETTLAPAAPAEPSPLDTDEIPVVVEKRRPSALQGAGSLGTVALVLIVSQALGGLGLLFFYRPLVASAHLDLVDLVEVSRFGYVRELHLWGSHALVIVVALHLFQAVVTGTYRSPKCLNFQVGVALGGLVLLLAVTGYVLPWDEHAQWLLRVLDSDSAMSDGPPSGDTRPGDAVLTAIYALHCGVLPVVAVLAILYHLHRARRDAACDEPPDGNGD